MQQITKKNLASSILIVIVFMTIIFLLNHMYKKMLQTESLYYDGQYKNGKHIEQKIPANQEEYDIQQLRDYIYGNSKNKYYKNKKEITQQEPTPGIYQRLPQGSYDQMAESNQGKDFIMDVYTNPLNNGTFYDYYRDDIQNETNGFIPYNIATQNDIYGVKNMYVD